MRNKKDISNMKTPRLHGREKYEIPKEFRARIIIPLNDLHIQEVSLSTTL